MPQVSSNPNAAVIARFLDEVWNQGKESTIDELYAPDGFAEGLGEQHREGPAQFKMFHQLVTATCGDLFMDLKNIMSDGDWVSFRATMNCTHKGSGKKIAIDGGGFARVSNGKIVEAYNTFNFLDMIVQLGAAPADVLPQTLLTAK